MKRMCICLEDYESGNNYSGYIIDFEKTKTYEYLIYYSNIKDINYKRYMLYDEENSPLHFDKDVFKKYFIDVNKYRKLKLKKIKKASI